MDVGVEGKNQWDILFKKIPRYSVMIYSSVEWLECYLLALVALDTSFT